MTIQRKYSFYHCDLKSASCHSRVHFCDISTSESSPRSSVFNTFDFKTTLFAPQRRALFDSFQKSSEPEVFLTFCIRNLLRATLACIFSTSRRPKVGPNPLCFYQFGFEMCFAPQCRTLSFSTTDLPKVLRT